MSKITISIRTHIAHEDIKDLLDSASRGSAYWARQDLSYESECEAALTEKGVEIDNCEEYEGRFVLGEWKKDAAKVYILNLPRIKKGLTVMAKKHPAHFADFIKGDYDQNTGDVFLQCCLFGEVIYG